MVELRGCLFEGLKKLVVGVDGSEAANFAAEAALRIAKACGAVVDVVCVVEVPVIAGEIWESLSQVIGVLEARADEVIRGIKEKGEGFGVECRGVRYTGEFAHEYIIEEARRDLAGLIVIGKKGAMLGAVGRKVIGESPCEVLVIPAGARFYLDRILIATDGSVYSRVAAERGLEVAKRVGCEVVVVSVAKNEVNLRFAEENVKEVVERAEGMGLKVEGVVMQGEPFEKIVEVADKKAVDLIVMGRLGRTGFEKIFVGSVAERVIGFSGRPVLIVPKK